MGLRLEDINYIYSENTVYEISALKDINIEIGDNEFIGIIGHTGSGKSTLIQHLNGLIKATSGRILYNGTDIYEKDFSMRTLRQKVGLVFQYPEHQLFESEVFLDVCFGPRNLGLSDSEVKQRAVDALKQVGVKESIYHKSPFELSGGQKRRVAIAGILAMKPEVLILDEPTAGLDPKGRNQILDLITKLYNEGNMTIILVSHSMEDVAKYVKRLIVMNHGQVAFDDTTKKVFAHYEELEKIGLSAPQITYAMAELANSGFDNEISDVITVEEAVSTIKNILGEPRN